MGAALRLDYGTGFAFNPRTGQREQVYAVAPLDPLADDWSDYRFASDTLTPQHQSLAGWAPGFHSDNSGTWSNFMERAVLGGLLVIGGAAAGGGEAAGGVAAEGAEGGEVLGGAESLSGASAETVGAEEVGAGAANEAATTFQTAAKTIGAGLSLARAWQNYRLGRSDRPEGAADVSPTNSAPWGNPGGRDVPTSDSATATDLTLPFIVFGIVLLIIFLLKGR